MAVIDLWEDCLSRADFYVVCTRMSSARSLLFLAPKDNTKHVVDEKVLRWIKYIYIYIYLNVKLYIAVT